MKGFKQYNRLELIDSIKSISIERVGECIVTKYNGCTVNTTIVSNLYEIFDIRSFLLEKIDNIESNFNISYYKLHIKGGIQELTLLSDSVEINDNIYYKSFFILNSSNKSRKLNMNMGLYRKDGLYLIYGANNMSISKKHLSGVTKAAENVSTSIDGETFKTQIECIRSLVGEKVLLSNLRNIIVDKDQQINHTKFNNLKSRIISSIKLNREDYLTLRTDSTNLSITKDNDISLDAHLIFNLYMDMFKNQDSYIVKKESDKILKITQFFIRNEKLSKLLDLL